MSVTSSNSLHMETQRSNVSDEFQQSVMGTQRYNVSDEFQQGIMGTQRSNVSDESVMSSTVCHGDTTF